jgi:hypothetical protein
LKMQMILHLHLLALTWQLILWLDQIQNSYDRDILFVYTA